MARRYTYISDLTGALIDSEDQLAQIRVLDHPLIDQPVKLDAFLLEVANIKDSKRELVTIEVVEPGGEPIRHILELSDFDKMIKVGNPDDVLNSAERYYEHQAVEPKRRGRPRGTSPASKPATKPTGSGMSKEQLIAVREWLRSQGHEVSERGRIKADLLKLWEEAHAS